MKSPFCLLAALVFLSVLAPAQAGLVFGTGLAGVGQRDTNWQVVGLPTAWAEAPGMPYDAYIFNNGGVGWYGGEPFGPGPQTGYTNDDGTFLWIGITSSHGSVIPFPTVWHWIVAQTFTIAEAGFYDITFTALADELLTVFLNGSVTTSDYTPTITGGTMISDWGAPFNNGVTFGTPTTVNTSAYLNAGENTIYAQVRDAGFSTGLLLSEFSFTEATPVPEPGTWAAAALLVGGAAFARWHRRNVS